MRVDVDVRVDQPRHQRIAREVVGDRPGGRVVAVRDASDVRVVDDDGDVIANAALAVDEVADADDDVALGRENTRRDAKGEREVCSAEDAAQTGNRGRSAH